MKQLLVLSGKGGTGKTTVSTAIIKLFNITKYADCDVDAPNLHLSIQPLGTKKESVLFGMKKALIHEDICRNCGICQNYCRFDAIYLKENQYTIDPILCEGCQVCKVVCPHNAITMEESPNGTLQNTESNESFFTTATLEMGSGNSGFLVSEVKNQLKYSSIIADVEVIDGSPGIGCPVISSITGVDLVLVVAEPSVSGFEDMKRVIETAKRMNVKSVVCVNKFNINLEKTNEIEYYCTSNKIPFLGRIPFDDELKKIAQGIDSSNHSPGIEVVKQIMDQILSIWR